LSTSYGAGCCALGLSGTTQPIYGNSVDFNTQTGSTVSSTVSPAGTYYWNIKVQDATGNSSTQGVYLTINPSTSANPPAITTTSLPDATMGQPYSTQIQVSGGTAPYDWSLISTTYPSGCCALGLNGNTQPIYGNSITFDTQTGSTVSTNYPAGTYSWVIQVKDSKGNTVTKILNLTIK